MGTAEGPPNHQRMPCLCQPCHGVDLRGLQGFLLRHVRQNGGQPPGQHGFARSRGTDEQDVVPAGGGDLQRPLRVFLSHDIREVRAAVLIARLRFPHGSGGEGRFAPQMGNKLLHGLHSVNGHTPGQSCLGGVFRRHIELVYTRPLRGHGHGQHAVYGPQPACEAQFPHKSRVRRQGGNFFRRRQNTQQDGQIVHRALLASARRGQIHGDAADGVLGTAVFHRCPHPLPGLLHRRVRQTHDVKGGQTTGEKALHADLVSADAV